MPRLPTYHETEHRRPHLESHRPGRAGSLTASHMPRVFMLILVGVTLGAALTVATMAITDSPESRLTDSAQAPVRRGSQSGNPRSAMQTGGGSETKPQHKSWVTITTHTEAPVGFTMASSSWKGHRGTPILQALEGRAYKGFKSAPLKHDGLVHAMVTSKAHEYLALETRLWRKNRRTYIATNYTLPDEQQAEAAKLNEFWEYYPDDHPLRTFALQGDSRAALTPFLAHRHFGNTYKWLLYGDDDTFFMDHALMLTLQDLDPDMPYFLTDHMWWQEYLDGHPDKVKPHSIYHPHEKAPVCVPCHYTRNTSGLPFPSPVGCPCTPEMLCNADPEQEFLAKSGPRGACGMPRVPVRSFSMHGGAGAVLSIGLMKAISFEWFEDCVHNAYSTGGDAIVSLCIWEAGYGMTSIDPLWHPRNQSMFDVGRVGQGDTESLRDRLAVVLRTYLQKAAGVCSTDMCQLEWNHTLTLHLRSRKFPSQLAHAEFTRMLTGLANFALGQPNPFTQRSKNTTMQLTNDQVLLGLQAIKELSKIPTQPKKKGEPFNKAVMEDANIAAADAVAHAILDAIWEHAARPPPPPTPTPSAPSVPVNGSTANISAAVVQQARQNVS